MKKLQILDAVISIIIFTYSAAFLFGRAGEWSLVVCRQPLTSAAVFLVVVLCNVALPYLQLSRPSIRIQLLAIVGIIFYFWDIATAVRSAPEVDLSGIVVVVTGANSGIGFYSALALISRNATLVLACRSEQKCSDAAENMKRMASARSSTIGHVLPMQLDLGDLQSVDRFSQRLALKFPRVDVLINNAGFNNAGSMQPDPPTVQGLENHFGSMHVGHFVLTELVLLRNARGAEGVTVVNVASGMHHFCSVTLILQVWSGGGNIDACLPKTFLQSSFAETGSQDFFGLPHLQAKLSPSVAHIFNMQQVVGDMRYNRAKLANVLHANELPRRHPGLLAYSVDLGFVVTNVTSWMRWMQVPLGVLPPLDSLGAVRLAEPHGIRPVLLAACWPYAKTWFQTNGLAPFPNGGLIDPLGRASKPFEIEERLEDFFLVGNFTQNRSALAAELFEASLRVMRSLTAHELPRP